MSSGSGVLLHRFAHLHSDNYRLTLLINLESRIPPFTEDRLNQR